MKPNVSIYAKPDGPCFSPDSSFLSNINLVPKTGRLTLSRIYETLKLPACPEPITPPSILAPVQLDIMEEIEQSHSSEAPPPTCPPTKLYVPSSLHQRVIQWTHESLSSGHPGNHRTSQMLFQRFWWPPLRSDVEGYDKSCPAYAQSRTSHHLPEGLLEMLPIPHPPWSHLSTDFLTDLPESHGYSAAMVVIDRFSKACKLILMKGLPTAMETAQALFHNVQTGTRKSHPSYGRSSVNSWELKSV